MALTTTGDLPPGVSNTEGFVSLIPFVRGELGALFLETRLHMNLDDPYGFSFDDSLDRFGGYAGGFWAWYFIAGGTFG